VVGRWYYLRDATIVLYLQDYSGRGPGYLSTSPPVGGRGGGGVHYHPTKAPSRPAYPAEPTLLKCVFKFTKS
jgi:hypothetical protein